MSLEVIELTLDELQSLPLLEQLVKIRQGSIATLKAFYSKMSTEIFRNADLTEFPEESWTFRKLVRRLLEFERENLAEIKLLVKALEKERQEKK